uniref:Polycomb group protein ASXL1 n=1 Tax=Gadus morhua TaxID=8049 RepID=A0A8C5F6H4_GADMO
MKDKQKRKKERTWAEAARMVLENFSDAPMTPKQILHVIQTKGLKEMSGTAPLACLVTMLHSQVRGDRVKNSIFFKLPGRMSLFTLKVHLSSSIFKCARTISGDRHWNFACNVWGPFCFGAEQESCDSTETTANASGENDGRLTDMSWEGGGAPSSPDERYGRHSRREQRKKAVMMPRVVLTPLKVNGEHVPSGKYSMSDRLPTATSPPPPSSSSSPPSGAAGRRREASRGTGGPTLRARPDLGWKRPMKRNRGGVDVDFETPGSILVNTNIRALINVRTFSAFPAHSQQQLLQLLPEVDRQVGPDGMARLSSSALNNEFFTHASQSWKERLAEGEFTHEMQVRFRQEMEKEKKVEAWKEKFFEEYHGQKSGLTREESLKLTMSEAAEVAGGVLDDEAATAAAAATGTPKRRSVGRRRRDGRMRRRTRADLRRRARRTLCKAATPTLQSPEPSEAGGALLDTSAAEVVLQADSGLEVAPPAAECPPAEPEPAGASAPAPVTDPAPVTPAAAAPDPSASPAPTHRPPSSSSSSSAAAAAAAQLKEQKRRPDEAQAFASFPEKRPRIDDRQSFRTTIDGVRTEKPPPAAEEPKVPPIRIQLSRIKPPWVKGPPTYQICPRIVPAGEGSRRSGTGGARTLADIKARAQQGS